MRIGTMSMVLAALAFSLSASAAAAANSGTVKVVVGDVRVERDGRSVPLKVGDALREKDRVVVASGGNAGLTLRDDTLVSLGPNSTFVIDRFEFDATTHAGRVQTSILRGAMRYVSGLIARRDQKSATVAMPTATIGVRGTEFIVEVRDAR